MPEVISARQHWTEITDTRKHSGTTFLWRLTKMLKPYKECGYRILYNQSGVAVVFFATSEALRNFVAHAQQEGMIPTT